MQQSKNQATLTHRIAVISRSNKSRIAPFCTRKTKDVLVKALFYSVVDRFFWRADRTGSRLFKTCCDFVLYNAACQKPKVNNENTVLLLLIKTK
jgi:hypothetical protein